VCVRGPKHFPVCPGPVFVRVSNRSFHLLFLSLAVRPFIIILARGDGENERFSDGIRENRKTKYAPVSATRRVPLAVGPQRYGVLVTESARPVHHPSIEKPSPGIIIETRSPTPVRFSDISAAGDRVGRRDFRNRSKRSKTRQFPL